MELYKIEWKNGNVDVFHVYVRIHSFIAHKKNVIVFGFDTVPCRYNNISFAMYLYRNTEMRSILRSEMNTLTYRHGISFSRNHSDIMRLYRKLKGTRNKAYRY